MSMYDLLCDFNDNMKLIRLIHTTKTTIIIRMKGKLIKMVNVQKNSTFYSTLKVYKEDPMSILKRGWARLSLPTTLTVGFKLNNE